MKVDFIDSIAEAKYRKVLFVSWFCNIILSLRCAWQIVDNSWEPPYILDNTLIVLLFAAVIICLLYSGKKLSEEVPKGEDVLKQHLDAIKRVFGAEKNLFPRKREEFLFLEGLFMFLGIVVIIGYFVNIFCYKFTPMVDWPLKTSLLFDGTLWCWAVLSFELSDFFCWKLAKFGECINA